MHIKALQITGFKSFLDKTHFSFQPGITGIVGPNGCGKSNVVDAMRWAMGEQSPKHLRGKGMQDVIFAGSEGHAGVGMAEVSIIFDTSDGAVPPAYQDYPEIQITRRLYRTGESEYLINKTPCRLRDVRDFFRDTGIGTHGYTIVEQGQIAGIVSARPEDRRLLIEEAAGISKYKARRHEAELKMKATTQNLTRVDDILGELRRQKSSLERQAKKAVRYKRLQASLRTLELSIAYDDYGSLSEEMREHERQLEEIRSQSTALELQMAEREVEFERLRVELTEAEHKVTEGNERLYGVRSQIKEVEGRIGYEKRERAQIAEGNEVRAAEIAGLQAQLESNEAEFQEVTLELQEVELDLGRESELLRAAQTEAQRAGEALRGLEQSRGGANKSLVERLTTIAGIENRVTGIEDRRRDIGDRAQALEQAGTGQQQEIAGASRELEALESRLVALGQERVRAEETLADVRSSQEDASRALQLAAGRLHEDRRQHDERAARFSSLQSLLERGEDVGSAARHLLQGGDESKQRFGIRSLVRDVLEVDSAVECAVEAVLAERADALVLTGSQNALSAIETLREAKAGRGVFVVETLPAATEDPTDLPGRQLLDMVRPKAGFEDTARALFAKVRWVEDLAPILDRYRGTAIPVTFVSAAGDVLTPEGVIKGGGEDVGAGMLARVREARELETEVEGLERTLLATEQAHGQAERIFNAAQERVETQRQAQHDAALAVANHERDLAQARERRRALALSEERRVQEFALLQEERERIGAELDQLRVRLTDQRCEHATHQAELDRIEGEIASAAAEVHRRQEQVTQCKVDCAGRIEKRDRLRSAKARAQAAAAERKQWIARREEEMCQALTRSEDLLHTLAEAEEKLVVFLCEEEELRSAQDALRESFEQRNATLRELEQAVRELRGKSSARKESLQSESLKLQQLEMRFEHLVESVREKWDIEIETWTPPIPEAEQVEELAASGEEESEPVGDELSPETGEVQTHDEEKEARLQAKETVDLLALSIEERKKRLEDVRRKLASLGEVNVAAIEEHEEIGERFRFLSEQKEDLESTMSSLKEAIARINRTSRKRFRETFEKVNARFKENFPRLFRGGRAELILIEAEDVLDAGVDIVAMPPGKRLQNVGLLSGGEKTMTAIALLVSLFQVHASPFFLLDEVDAALDDANVGRFNEIVREMAEQSQFLVITHNKRTIELADVLHGVTMERRGISKLVTVELS